MSLDKSCLVLMMIRLSRLFEIDHETACAPTSSAPLAGRPSIRPSPLRSLHQFLLRLAEHTLSLRLFELIGDP